MKSKFAETKSAWAGKLKTLSAPLGSQLHSSWRWGIRHWKLLVGGGLVAIIAVVGLISYKNSIQPEGIIIHHTGPLNAEGQPVDVEFLDSFHQERGYGSYYWGRVYHVGYHYIILPNGGVQEGRPEHLHGAHAQGFNSYLGIALVGNFSARPQRSGTPSSDPTPAQLRSLIALSKDLSRRYHIPASRILRHSDVAQTECPGQRLPYRNVVAAVYGVSSVAQQPIVSKNAK
ncbi:MAG: N-acetylmuramyl-L-alanine amidase, negative regulator of AmpC, AmpD [Candidatus Angelobacter sp.]|jgi:N-acetyl-anhydromuramyl-L-alanine amidase AmpD|nr:N-acetylmuramyl-L-alanine amidase, negative regulator of AmpC, AmpD [Candidatus Angelobacter sp.]